MLTALSLRDVVLIDRQDIVFGPGLSVLTGETGAGKSILLDGLGLALGARADAGLVARDATEASAVACFAPPSDHPVRALLAEQGIGAEDEILLRRVLSRDGRSRGFINDQPVGVGLLRRVGSALVEMQSQNAQIGLADPPVQRALLDAFGVDSELTGAVSTAFSAWRTAARAAEEAALGRERTEQNAQWLAHVIEELDALGPEPDEEERLAIERQTLQEEERRAEAFAAALAELAPRGSRSGSSPAAAVRASIRALSRLVPPAAGAMAALERAEEALGEAESLLMRQAETETGDPRRLERAETRLFALRAVARKHGVSVAELPELCLRLKAELGAIEDEAAIAQARTRDAASAREAYVEAAGRLAAARAEAGRRLEAALARELAPLRLEKARFHCRLENFAERDWGPEGTEAVSFLLAANPGQEPAPLARAASGGELARLMLALKVVLIGARNPGTLIFDEVDAGIGGAAAAAVGERLARIAERVQVLVVTHSPQVAVHGRQHFRITKEAGRGRATTRVIELEGSLRQEEIARMLAGATVTDAARAAAASLLSGPQPAPRRRGLRAGR
ncbi:MAG TPA: DNA repair protein RecN [Acetobacteraceae bacterium]|nr:DNA repair protein RecN [Acetobacteraceae bacterium]